MFLIKALYFQLYHSQSVNPWFASSSLSRKSIVNINRIRSDHNSLKLYSLFKFKITDNDLCSCGFIEDENHVLWTCNKYTKERKIMIEKFNKRNVKTPVDIKEILKIMKAPEVEIFSEFLNECKINI